MESLQAVLARQHAAVAAELASIVKSSGGGVGAMDARVADAVSAAMADSGRKLSASIDAGRAAQTSALQAVVAGGRKEAADAAAKLLRNMGDLKELQAVQIELATRTAVDVAAVKAVVTETHADVKTLLTAVEALTAKLDALTASATSPPAAVVDVQVEIIMTVGSKGRSLQRLLAFAQANAADDGFTISAKLAGHGHGGGAGSLARGMRARPVEVSRAVVGSPVVLEIVASRDCYFYVIEQDSGGGLCPLVPSNAGQARVDNKLTAGVARKLPDASKGDTFAIDFCPPAGWETLFVFATHTPWREWDSLVIGAVAAVEEKLARGVVARGIRARPVETAAAADNFTVAACAHIFELFES